MSELRRNTKSVYDFIYWIYTQIGDDFEVKVRSSFPTPGLDPTAFDGAELVQWAANQVGLYMPRTANEQIEWCRKNGTEIPLMEGILTRGAILWTDDFHDGHIGISIGKSRVIQDDANGRVSVVVGDASKVYKRAGKIPGLLYR